MHAADGLRVIHVESEPPAFAAVEGRLLDPATEAAVSREIRSDLPDLVHMLDYGGATTVNASWVANRLGVATVVSLRSAPVLCHRGDLVHADGSTCGEWLDAARCAACCQRSSPGGLSRFGATLAGILTALRWPLHPYPSLLAFENRRELLLGGLQVVDRVCVEDEAEADRVRSLGIRAGHLEILPRAASAAEWLAGYAAVSQ